MLDIVDEIVKWQNINDSEFNRIPNDDLYSVILDYYNYKVEFMFSCESKARSCISNIPRELLLDCLNIINQENGLTYYMRGNIND